TSTGYPIILGVELLPQDGDGSNERIEFSEGEQSQLHWVAPLVDGRKELRVTIDLVPIWQIADQYQFGGNGGIILLDQNSRVISHRNKTRLQTRLSTEPLDSRGLQFESLEGQTYYAVSSLWHPAGIADTDSALTAWTILASFPKNPIDELVLRAALWQGGIAVFASLLAWGVGYFLSRRLTQELSEATAAASAMATGNLAARAPVQGPAEIRQLAASFNEMAETVESHQSHLAELVEEKTAQLSAVHDATREAIWVISREGETLLSNAAFERLFNVFTDSLSPGEVAQALISQFEDSDDLRQWLGQSMERPGSLAPQRWNLRHVENGVVKIYSAPIHDNQGEPFAILYVFSDLTEETTLERKLEQARSLETVSTLSAGMAHEFNNLLTGITGNLEIIRSSLEGTSEVESIDSARDCTQRAANLVQGMLSFSQQEFLDQDEVTAEAILEPLLYLEHRSISLRTFVEPGLPKVQADIEKIHRVLNSLITNAVEAMPDGGKIQVKVSRYTELVVNNADESQNFVSFEIEDTGEGIDPAKLDEVFSPFFTTRTGQQGLGLASCHGIISQHGGWMEIDSSPGEGTRVRFVLCAGSEMGSVSFQRSRSMEAAHQVDEDDKGKSILVVDDDLLVRRVIQAILERGGYDVISVDSGTAALEAFALREAEIQLVVLDLRMPGMMGTEVFERLRADFAPVPVVICSGYLRDFDGLRTINGEMPNAFLEKPVSSADMLQTIQSVIREAA
ncbi:MAG: ATP-binding protein, partial [Verrucomicrobiota bacterium]